MSRNKNKEGVGVLIRGYIVTLWISVGVALVAVSGVFVALLRGQKGYEQYITAFLSWMHKK